MKINKIRADLLLLKQYSIESRSKAQAIIMSGIVYHKNLKICKSGFLLNIDDKLEIHGKKNPYVSRGGIKLEHAISNFKIEIKNKIIMDIGASTGGFTDFLLKNNAKQVYAIDVGYGQLDWKLRNDNRVICMERQNVKYLNKSQINILIDIIVMDLSFISIKVPLKNLKQFLNINGDICVLIKPQFELEKHEVEKKGIIISKSLHEKVLNNFINFAIDNNFFIQNITYSPIKGMKGNIEFFGHLKLKNNYYIQKNTYNVKEIVNNAHTILKV